MSDRTRSSQSGPSRQRQVNRATQASTAIKKYHICETNGCNRRFKNQTDLSRHKWRHLPKSLRPTCPYEGPSGELCDERYVGRADQIKDHYRRIHPEAGDFPDIIWPTLSDILNANGMELGDHAPGPLPAHFPYSQWMQAGPFTHGNQPYFLHNQPQPFYPFIHGYNPMQLMPPFMPPIPPPSLYHPHYPPIPPFPYHHMYNHPHVHGPAQDYAHVAAPPAIYHPAATQQFSNSPDYFNYDHGEYSPIGGPYTSPFNTEFEHQGSSTNPHAGQDNQGRQDWSPYANDNYQEF